MDGILSPEEMNHYGQSICDMNWMCYGEDDFGTDLFDGINWTAEGVTKYGFMQIVMKDEPDYFNDNLKRLGYDESLYSHKCRVFTISFHTEYDLRVRIGDACKTEINERAWDLMMENWYIIKY